MREITTKIYPFSELNDKAKNRALESFRDINVDYDWWDSVYEMWTESLREEIGINKAEISSSGFYSQGDGASFSGNIDNKWLSNFVIEHKDSYPILASRIASQETESKIEIFDAVVIRNQSRNSHEYTCRVSVDVPVSDEVGIEGEVGNLEIALEEIRLNLCRELYRDLERQYEFLTSDEMIAETIEANEYEFDESGKFVPGV